MLKILQARLQQEMNCELPDVQAVFRKSRGTRSQRLPPDVRAVGQILSQPSKEANSADTVFSDLPPPEL